MIIGGYFEAKFDEVTGLYDREYSSDEYASRWSRFVSDGIAIEGGGELTTQNQVSIITDTMKTRVEVGVGFIKGRDYQIVVAEEVEHEAADPTHKRIDRVVIELNLTEEVRAFVVKAIKGIPESEPVAPFLIRTDEIWQLSLAQIEVPSNVVALNTGVITDERGDVSLCGLSNIKQGISPPDVGIINALTQQIDDVNTELQQVKTDIQAVSTSNTNHQNSTEIHRNITSGTVEPSGGSDGDIYLQYE